MSLSILAQIKGFLDYQKDSKIKGVILNQTSEMTCRMLTPKIESELGICVFGYVPKIADWHLESRHLGLVLPDEISDLREQMQRLADILEKTLDIESILQIHTFRRYALRDHRSQWQKMRHSAFCMKTT